MRVGALSHSHIFMSLTFAEEDFPEEDDEVELLEHALNIVPMVAMAVMPISNLRLNFLKSQSPLLLLLLSGSHTKASETRKPRPGITPS